MSATGCERRKRTKGVEANRREGWRSKEVVPLIWPFSITDEYSEIIYMVIHYSDPIKALEANHIRTNTHTIDQYYRQ